MLPLLATTIPNASVSRLSVLVPLLFGQARVVPNALACRYLRVSLAYRLWLRHDNMIAMETPSSNHVPPPEDGREQALMKARRLRQQRDFDAARSLLETAVTQWPESPEVKDLLLQTEKDQLAAKVQNRGEVDTELFAAPWQAIVLGAIGILGMGTTLFLMGETVLYMVRFGFGASQAVYTRGTYSVYYVPAHSTLTLWSLGFCFCVWIIRLAAKNFR